MTVISGQAIGLYPGNDGKTVVTREQDFLAVPHSIWSNRGEDRMAVWLPRKSASTSRCLRAGPQLVDSVQQLLPVLVQLEHRVRDVVHVLARAEEQPLVEAHGLLAQPVRVGAGVVARIARERRGRVDASVGLRRERLADQALPVHATFLDHTEALRDGNALGLQRSEEPV